MQIINENGKEYRIGKALWVFERGRRIKYQRSKPLTNPKIVVTSEIPQPPRKSVPFTIFCSDGTHFEVGEYGVHPPTPKHYFNINHCVEIPIKNTPIYKIAGELCIFYKDLPQFPENTENNPQHNFYKSVYEKSIEQGFLWMVVGKFGGYCSKNLTIIR